MNRSLARLVALAVASCAAHPSFAQDQRGFDMDYAERDLNKTYAYVMSHIHPEDRPKLQEAERAWLSFRDKDCLTSRDDRRDCIGSHDIDRTNQLQDSEYRDSTGHNFTYPK